MAICFVLAQFIRPKDFGEYTKVEHGGEEKKGLHSLPERVQDILGAACYDCHSDQPDLQWFDKITPVNFIVDSHIKNGRKALNFSKFDELNSQQVSAKLFYSLNKVLSGEMPLASYSFVHPRARLSKTEIRQLQSYLLSISPRTPADSVQLEQDNKAYGQLWDRSKGGREVLPAPNGISYIPDYQQWKAISTTDRFDNGSMRIIYANAIAIKAIESGHSNPWPDGTVFAKTAWAQEVEKDGVVRMGKFIQVEFMIKDARKYAGSDGWGWARWRGDTLTPYGGDANFVQECMNCHQPAKKFDYVFTSPLNLNPLNVSR